MAEENQYVTREECDRLRSDVCEHITGVEGRMVNRFEIHDIQAKSISNDIREVRYEMREITDTQKQTALIQKQNAENMSLLISLFKTMFMRFIYIIGAVALTLVGAYSVGWIG